MRTITGVFLTSILVLVSGEPAHAGQPTWPQTWGGPGAATGQSIAFDSKIRQKNSWVSSGSGSLPSE